METLRKRAAERIELLLKQQGLKQKELAMLLNHSQGWVSRILDEGPVRLADIDLIADALHVSPLYLLGWDEDQRFTVVEEDLLDRARRSALRGLLFRLWEVVLASEQGRPPSRAGEPPDPDEER